MATEFNNLYHLYIENIKNNAKSYLKNIREIISKDDLNMDENILEKINNLSSFLLSDNKLLFDNIIQQLSKLNISTHSIQRIISILQTNYSYNFVKKFLNYLTHKKINFNEEENASVIKFQNYFYSYKQQWQQLFKDLYEIKQKNNGGNGQILFAILFNNCTKSTDKSDITYKNNKKIEIKTNRGILANNYNGEAYGNNADMAPFLIEQLKNHIKNFNDKNSIFKEYEDKQTKLNFSKKELKNNNCAIIDLFNEVNKINELSLEKAQIILGETLQKVYKLATLEDMQFLLCIKKEDNMGFTINGKDFMLKFIRFTINYYMNVQQFDYLTFMDAQNAIIFPKTYLQQDDFGIFENHISIQEFLSFSKNTKRKVAMSMRVKLYK